MAEKQDLTTTNLGQEKESGKIDKVSPKRLGLKIGSTITTLFFLPVPKIPALGGTLSYSPEPVLNVQDSIKSGISKPLSIDRDGKPVVEIPGIAYQRPSNLPAVREIKKPTAEKFFKVVEITGLRFDQSSGYYFAEAGNPYGLGVGELAGFRKENALMFKDEKGEIKWETCIGLLKKVINPIQKETFEKTKERLLPILFDLTVTKDVTMQELKIAGDEIGKTVWAFNVPVGAEILSPLSGGWGLIKPFPNVEDNCFFTDWNIGVEGQLGGWDIYFRDAEILAKMKEGASIPNPKTGTRQTLMSTEVGLGDSLGRINSLAPLEEFAKSGWGDYQVVTFLKNDDRIMEVGTRDNVCKVFIFNQ